MLWAPTDSAEVVKVEAAVLAPFAVSAVPKPRNVSPSKNSTEPVGGPPLPFKFVTVAVNVTFWPNVEGLRLETTPVEVPAFTVCVSEPLLPRKSPVGV